MAKTRKERPGLQNTHAKNRDSWIDRGKRPVVFYREWTNRSPGGRSDGCRYLTRRYASREEPRLARWDGEYLVHYLLSFNELINSILILRNPHFIPSHIYLYPLHIFHPIQQMSRSSSGEQGQPRDSPKHRPARNVLMDLDHQSPLGQTVTIPYHTILYYTILYCVEICHEVIPYCGAGY